MKSLKENLYSPLFSHIYIEKKAYEYEITNKILSQFNNSEIIEIDHYKDVFCRKNQNYTIQKKSTSLIIALKNNNLIYKGAKVCHNFGNHNFYYTSCVMNCIYECEYCYLQGMYPSGNIVVFVNLDDYFLELSKLIKENSIYLSISYDTDLLALENILSYCERWIYFVRENENIVIEIRTKSANFKALSNLKPDKNVILAWTVSPEDIIKNYEINTPSFKARFQNILSALEHGWKVRLCFDPIIYVKNYKIIYREFIDYVFSNLPKEKIFDVSIGVFRISSEYLKKMRKQNPYSSVINFPFENDSGVFHYGKKLSHEIVSYVYELTKNYMPKEKIFLWEENI